MPEMHDGLVLALDELGERLELPAGANPVATAVDRIRVGRPRDVRHRPRAIPGASRLLAVAATVALVALATVLAAPGSRHAVARWLGIGSVTVTYTGEVPAGAGRTYDLGRPVPLAQAVERADAAGWRLAAPTAAGEPARAFVGSPAGSVSLVWAPSDESPDLPEVGDSGIGLLLTAMPGTTDAGGMAKQAAGGTTVRIVPVGDELAYWIAGEPHEVLITDAAGRTISDSSRLAANTLVWTEGDVTFRLESELGRDAAVDLASNLAPVRP
jgi:hypothetical protein